MLKEGGPSVEGGDREWAVGDAMRPLFANF